MASPQKENGYVPVANEIYDALARTRIPGEARQVLDLILRKTYGFNKNWDQISLSQFVVSTKMSKTRVCQAIRKLYSMNIITKKGNLAAISYRLNKNFDTWRPLPKKVTLPKTEIEITKKGKKYYRKQDIQKTVSKDTLTKDNTPDFPEAEIIIPEGYELPPEVRPPTPVAERLILGFKGVNSRYKQMLTDPEEIQAAERLVETHGEGRAMERVGILHITNKIKFMPRALSPSELEEKWDRIELQAMSLIGEDKKNKVLI